MMRILQMMVHERLNADRLGRKGESHFQEICDDAGLDYSKSNPDRTGWDFIVDLPSSLDSYHPLDKRPPPISAYIQTKTLFAHNDKFEMRLFSAMRLTQRHNPAFIYIFKVNSQTKEIVEAYLIHIIDEILSKILKRLRKEEYSGHASDINKKNISFSTNRYSIILEPTGAALREALKEACGNSLEDYTTRKSKQLRHLGFGLFPFSGSLRFRGLQDINELVEVFLGLKQNIEIVDLKFFEERFGIAIPIHQMPRAGIMLSIAPNPIDTCIITYKHNLFPSPIVFRGELYIPAIPNLPIEAFKFILKSQMFSFLISKNEASFWHNEDLSSQKHPPERWVDFTRLVVGLAAGGCQVQVRPGNRLPMEFEITEIETKSDIIAWSKAVKFCETLLRLFKLSGVPSDIGITMRDMEKSGKDVVEAVALLDGRVNSISFPTDMYLDFGRPSPIRTAFASYLEIGDVRIGYSAIMDLLPETVEGHTLWRSVRIEPGCACVLSQDPLEFSQFLQSVKVAAKTDIHLVRVPEPVPMAE